MQIGKISQKVSSTPNKVENNNSNHSNPFGAVVNGKLIVADVFTQANPSFTAKAVKGKITDKLKASALVSSISKNIGQRLDTIMQAGRNVREKLASTWNYLNTTKVTIFDSDAIIATAKRVVENIMPDREYAVSKMLNESPRESILGKFENIIAARGAN